MNIYDLRKAIIVTLFGSLIHNNNFAVIHYSVNGKPCVLKLPPHELSRELMAIGSIDNDLSPESFYQYTLSQWDALNIAIRHELAKEIEKEIDNSDIGEAIKNLKIQP